MKMPSISEQISSCAGGKRFGAILVDPPWETLGGKKSVKANLDSEDDSGADLLETLKSLPIENLAAPTSHLYLWVPNELLPLGLDLLSSWGFSYKSNLIWYKVKKDGGADKRGPNKYFRDVTEVILFGVRGKNARTLSPGRTQVNLIKGTKENPFSKPEQQYKVIESCSNGPFIEIFSTSNRKGWISWSHKKSE